MGPDRATSRAAIGVGLVGLVLTVAGIGVSIYLTIAHYQSASVLACPDTGIINCTKVTTSSYSTQFGIPLAVLGLGFFVVTLLFQNPWAWRSTSRLLRRSRVVVATGGAAMVLWLIWVELFRLDAICLYCTAVHALSILVFVLTVVGTAATAPAAADDYEDEDEDEDDADGPVPGAAGTRPAVPAR
ncbi:MAG TPA: vitamin K epoxide reductase family protein [Acidimicrobiales bacterium]